MDMVQNRLSIIISGWALVLEDSSMNWIEEGEGGDVAAEVLMTIIL
jgi:hypothetical protein